MKYVKLLSAVLFLALMAACSGGDGTKNALPALKFDEAFANIEDVGLSEYAKEIKYIPLETKEGALIHSISKFIEVEAKDGAGFFFRAHNSEKKGAHFFSHEGKYIRSIGTKGRAKGEFTFNTSLIPMYDRNEIAIGAPQKAVVYTLEDEFVREITYSNVEQLKKYNPNLWGLFYTGNGRFCNLMGAKTGIEPDDANLFMVQYDEQFGVEELFPVIKENVMEYMFANGPDAGVKQYSVAVGRFFVADNRIHYLRNSDDTLFVFDENCKLQPCFTFDYGEAGSAQFTKDLAESITLCGNEFGDLQKIGNCYMVPFSAPVKVYSKGISYLDGKKNQGVVLFDPKTSKSRILSYDSAVGMAGFTNDLDGGLPFYPSLVQNGKMYQVIEAITIIENAGKCSSQSLKEIAATLTEDSNPVVVEVTLK